MRTRSIALAALSSLLVLVPLALAQNEPDRVGRLFALDLWDEQHGMGLAELVGEETIQVVGTSDGAATFQVLYTLRREAVTEIATFAGGRMGILLGQNALFRTTNGGRRWNKSGQPFEMSKLRFVGSSGRGYMIGTPTHERGEVGPTLLSTVSKGLRWDPRIAQPASVQDYCFSTETLGWVIDDRGLHQTTDGRRFTLKKAFEQAIAVACHGDQHVWVLVGNKVHQSFDAGSTWFEHDVGSRAVFTSMQFVDGSHGWLYSDRELRATDDGGQHWALRMRAAGPPRFWDAQKGWCLGGNGDVSKTTDGGRTWQ